MIHFKNKRKQEIYILVFKNQFIFVCGLDQDLFSALTKSQHQKSQVRSFQVVNIGVPRWFLSTYQCISRSSGWVPYNNFDFRVPGQFLIPMQVQEMQVTRTVIRRQYNVIHNARSLSLHGGIRFTVQLSSKRFFFKSSKPKLKNLNMNDNIMVKGLSMCFQCSE